MLDPVVWVSRSVCVEFCFFHGVCMVCPLVEMGCRSSALMILALVSALELIKLYKTGHSSISYVYIYNHRFFLNWPLTIIIILNLFLELSSLF